MRPICAVLLAFCYLPATAARGQEVRYRLEVRDPATQIYHIEAELAATGDTTFVSLPAWTPGHYTIEDYARYVVDFSAVDPASSRALDWDQSDKDTWRIASGGVERIRVGYDYRADTVGLSLSLLTEDFGFFNGTNLFVYPEGSDWEYPSTLEFELPAGWRIATELEEASEPNTYRSRSYHELVDNPTFLGDFAIDSVMADGRWVRLAVYPGRFLRDPARELALDALQKIADYQHDLFGEPPYDRYTTLVYLALEPLPFFGGLEHAESHLDVLPAVAFQQPAFLFPIFYHLLAHEYYHAWNVKRIRPTDLWPYAYDREQFTPLLWVSEGITDYYANLTVVRTGLGGVEGFWDAVRSSIASVEDNPLVAVEDASLATWIEPTYLSQNYYYDKGLLLGLFLDIQIRTATGNRRSLDDVMARLYREHFLEGRGFTTDDFLSYVGAHVDRTWLDGFYRDHVDGREPLPYREMLGRAGMLFQVDTTEQPFFGVALEPRDGEPAVSFVEPGSTADEAGLRAGDVVERIGAVAIRSGNWAEEFRRVYADSVGVEIAVTYRRGDERRTGRGTLRTRTQYEHRIQPAPNAGDLPRAIGRSIVEGTTRPE